MTGEGPVRRGGPGPARQVQSGLEDQLLGGDAAIRFIEFDGCAMALAATLVGISIPATRDALDKIAPPLAARDMAARSDSPDSKRPGDRRRSRIGSCPPEQTTGSLRTPTAMTTACERSRSPDGPDLTLAAAERLGDKHSGVSFGLLAGLPDLDGSRASEEGVRVGSSRILTLSPDGTATPGTLYVHGSRGPLHGPKGIWRHRPHAGIPL